jgi:hypothetical protein
MKNGLIASLLLGAAALPAFAQVAKPTCDRACLEGYVNKYLDAMDANKVSDDLFARNTKFTENGIQLPLGGEGLWYGMSGKGTYKFYVPDIETQQIAFLGTMRENTRGTGEGNLVGLVLRLKITNNKISEVEQLVVRPDNTNSVTGGARAGGAAPAGGAPAAGARAGGPPAVAGGPAPAAGGAPRAGGPAPAAGGAAPAARPAGGFPPAAEGVERMGKPHAIYMETIPVAKRMSRDEYIKVANFYFSGLAPNDGTATEANGFFPFTDDCVRYENGMITTAQQNGQPVPGACKRQFETGLKGTVSRVRDRRFVAVDRERGIVFSFAFFDHFNINWTWQLGELFKIEDGKIRRIEALFHRAPFGINSGWSTYEQGMSEQPQNIR